jgi:crotonobetaine/carnitine-CoA ligase
MADRSNYGTPQNARTPSVRHRILLGVPSDLSEEYVMLWVVLKPEQALTEGELIAHCERAMASYMVPCYVLFADDLPKTPTEKVEKYKFQETGASPRTCDKEQVGE